MKWYPTGILVSLLALAMPTQEAMAYNVLHTSDGAELRWYDSIVPYYINTDGLTDFDPDELLETTRRCFTTWESLGFGIKFEFAGFTSVKSAQDDEKNVIFFVQDPNSWDEMFNGQETALAMTRTWAVSSGEIQGFDLAFNDWNYTFTNTDDPSLISTDFANTLTHEVGHVLGLDHSAVPEAVMYLTSPQGETSKRTLTYDDIDGISYLYRNGFDQEDGALTCSYRPRNANGRVGVLSLLLLLFPVRRLRSR